MEADTEFVPPLFVFEGRDGVSAMSVSASARALSGYLEPWFAEEEEYRAYDSEGRRLELVVEAWLEKRRWLWDRTGGVVVARATESQPRHQEELAELLRRWLHETSPSLQTRDLLLPQLVAHVTEHKTLG